MVYYNNYNGLLTFIAPSGRCFLGTVQDEVLAIFFLPVTFEPANHHPTVMTATFVIFSVDKEATVHLLISLDWKEIVFTWLL